MKRQVAVFTLGFGTGAYAAVIFPKTRGGKFTRWVYDAALATLRLRKVLEEEYYRIDDAIAQEESYLATINPFGNIYNLKFSVEDDGEDRSIHMEYVSQKTK